MSNGPQLVSSAETKERNWLPLAIAAGVVLIVAGVLVITMERSHKGPAVTPISAAQDPYAANLPLTDLAMSESGNLAGGKVTYVDGHVTNKGTRTVTGITVQALFRNYAHEVAQNDTQSLMLIRMRDPYIDVGTIATNPLKPGDTRDFRLIFDSGISADWDGAYPEVRIIHVDSR